MNIGTWLSRATDRIDGNGDSLLDVELLLAARLGKNRAFLRAFADDELCDLLSAQQLTTLEADLQRLADGYPLAYLLGKKAFWDMALSVNEATLIPRADTETLITVAQGLFPSNTQAHFADLGTGSGAIAIALSRVFTQATITATDISEAALCVARTNGRKWQIAPITWRHTSWLHDFAEQSLDVIVSNPPYIAEGDSHLAALSFEPMSALISENQGFADINRLIAQAQSVLKPNGWLLLEHGYDQGSRVRQRFSMPEKQSEKRSEKLWQNVTTYRDLGGNERVTVAQRYRASVES